jgi:hypothetical protein
MILNATHLYRPDDQSRERRHSWLPSGQDSSPAASGVVC